MTHPPDGAARFRRSGTASGTVFGIAFLLVLLTVLQGCGHFRSEPPPEYVYLSVKKRYLRAQLSFTADRVAEIKNGERLQVLDQHRRFLKVKTPKGKVGWIEEHSVIDQDQFAKFEALAKRHAGEKPVATAKTYDDLYMHIAPGRKPQHFYLLPPHATVSLLERASVPRKGRTRRGKVRIEDWWLARDGEGRTGWMLARDLNVRVPQSVARYSEGEQMLAAYVLRTVEDPKSGMPGGKVPEYLTVLRSYRQGLPYDFDQIRVFTWSTHRHHYETAYRLRNLEGFFPVKVTPGGPPRPGEDEPAFSFQVAADQDASLDPKTGRPRAKHLKWVHYRMAGNLVRQVTPPEPPEPPEGKSAAGSPPKAHDQAAH